MKASQCQIVLDHLIKHGYITEIIARSYGVRRLASRIYDLKRVGVGVQREMRKDDLGTPYAYYYLNTDGLRVERKLKDEGATWNSLIVEA